MKVENGGRKTWVQKGRKKKGQHCLQLKRRFPNWPWTPAAARSQKSRSTVNVDGSISHQG
jgi:hypothetical protein